MSTKYLTLEDMKIILENLNSNLPRINIFEQKAKEILQEGFSKNNGFDLIYQVTLSLLKLIDTTIIEFENKNNIASTCQKSCTFCCYQPIVATRFKIKMIIENINRLPQKRKQKMYLHIKKYRQKYQTELREAFKLDFENEQLIYTKLAIPCVFLNVDLGSCLIYEIRPIPCRTYVNYCDPEICNSTPLPDEILKYDFFYTYFYQILIKVMMTLIEKDKSGIKIKAADFDNLDYLPKLLFQEIYGDTY